VDWPGRPSTTLTLLRHQLLVVPCPALEEATGGRVLAVRKVVGAGARVQWAPGAHPELSTCQAPLPPRRPTPSHPLSVPRHPPPPHLAPQSAPAFAPWSFLGWYKLQAREGAALDPDALLPQPRVAANGLPPGAQAARGHREPGASPAPPVFGDILDAGQPAAGGGAASKAASVATGGSMGGGGGTPPLPPAPVPPAAAGARGGGDGAGLHGSGPAAGASGGSAPGGSQRQKVAINIVHWSDALKTGRIQVWGDMALAEPFDNYFKVRPGWGAARAGAA
jgi:hypothetical protein